MSKGIHIVRWLAGAPMALSGENAVVEWLHNAIPVIAAIIEIIGVAMIAYGCIAALWLFFRSRLDFNNKEVKLELAQALALALEFKLAAEILKSVIVHTINELILLASVVALRVVMTLLIHWEIQTSESEGDQLTYRQQTSDQTLSARYKQRADQRHGGDDSDDEEDGDGKGRHALRSRARSPKTHELRSEDGRESQMLRHRADTPLTPKPTLVMEHRENAPTHITHPRPDETLTSLTGARAGYRHVTREEDGLTASIERQIRRMTRRRRQVKDNPHDDVKRL